MHPAPLSTGAVYAEDSNAIFGGVTVFTKNTANNNGGTMIVKYTPPFCFSVNNNNNNNIQVK